MSFQRPYQVLIALHEGVDILDFSGPAEFLSLARHPGQSLSNESNNPFNVVTTAVSDIITTSIGIQVAPHISLREAYDQLKDFDILIIPGGSSETVLTNNATEPMALIKAFASLPPREGFDKIIMSVCTGALFLAKAGILEGQTAVTNCGDMDRLRKMVERTNTRVVDGQQRFVVNPLGGIDGTGRKGYRMMLSRGPGAGLDLSLWLVDHLVGEESRKEAEKLVEHEGRLHEGLIL